MGGFWRGLSQVGRHRRLMEARETRASDQRSANSNINRSPLHAIALSQTGQVCHFAESVGFCRS